MAYWLLENLGSQQTLHPSSPGAITALKAVQINQETSRTGGQFKETLSHINSFQRYFLYSLFIQNGSRVRCFNSTKISLSRAWTKILYELKLFQEAHHLSLYCWWIFQIQDFKCQYRVSKGREHCLKDNYTSNSPFRNTKLTLCGAGRYSICFLETLDLSMKWSPNWQKSENQPPERKIRGFLSFLL